MSPKPKFTREEIIHAALNKAFVQEEQQRKAEEHLQAAADIGRTNGISLEKLLELLTLFYQEEE